MLYALRVNDSFQIGKITIPFYNLFIIIGILSYILITVLVIEKKFKENKEVTKELLTLSIFFFLTLGVSAFLFNTIFHSIEKKKLVIGGITWLGGIVIMYPVALILIHKFLKGAKGKEMDYFSYIIPGMVLGHMFGRIGCFFAGCCFGKVTDLSIGIIYPYGTFAASLYPSSTGESLPVLPTQLFEAGFELLLFLVLMFLPKKLNKYNAEFYAIFYSLFRFVLEFFRGDDRGATALVLSPSQLLAVIFFIFGILSVLTRKGIIFKKIYQKLETWKKEERKLQEEK